MSKIKIYELAKELGVQSKDIIEFLGRNNIEVKSHMSSLEDADADMVKKKLSKADKPVKAEKPETAETPETQEKKEEAQAAPKKKNIVHVFRPQNTQNAGRHGARQGRPGQQGQQPQGRPMQVNNGRPAKPQNARPAQSTDRPQNARPAQSAARPQSSRPAQSADRPQSSRPAQSTDRPQNSRPAQSTDRPQNSRPAQGTSRPQNARPAQSTDRPQSGRPAQSADRGADRGEHQGNRPQGNRPQGNRPSRPQGGDRPSYQNDRNQGRRPSDRHDRPNDKKNTAAPSPALEGQKPQRSKGKGKDDYKKKDYRRDEDDRNKGKKQKTDIKKDIQKPQQKVVKIEEEIKAIVIPEVLTIKELADKMKIVPSVIVKKLFLQGKIVTVNQEIDYATAEEIALEFDVLCEKEEQVDVIEELLKEEDEDEKKMKKRPPVVCVMGHVDHGKTSLLDAIRHTNVIDREAGGITQHIGAYVVDVKGEKITFLDTPGHEAFTAMRMRGASSTDIAILVVAADDGVMPQTVEAINHAKAAGIEIVVAVNKIDKPSANIDRVKQELAEYELIPEDWGGSTIFVPVSAKSGEGLEELMEMLLLTAEVMELKANPNRRARGLIIEAELDKGKGPVATVLVQKGTLRVGDSIAAGSAHGKVRAMMDDKGRRVKEAGPSVPVEILGLNDVPNAGEVFVGCANDKDARSFAETFISQGKVKLLDDTKAKLSLDDLFTQIKEGNLKELGIVVKADVQGSVEALKQSLLKLSNDEVVVKIIHGGVGAINESDVSLASASNAIIIGFNVRPDATAKETAEREGVDLRLYRVIYNAIEDVEAAMKGLLDPVFEEKVLGHAEVRQTFKASGVGTIAGSYVLDGIFERDCSVRLTRDGIVIFDGPLASLKRFKDDVKEVRAGYECGFVFQNFNDIKEGDMVEAFKMVEIPR